MRIVLSNYLVLIYIFQKECCWSVKEWTTGGSWKLWRGDGVLQWHRGIHSTLIRKYSITGEVFWTGRVNFLAHSLHQLPALQFFQSASLERSPIRISYFTVWSAHLL